MDDQLVTYKTAKLAKDNGFDYPCGHYYNMDKDLFKTGKKHNLYQKITNDKEWDYLSVITAPTQTSLQKWLREVHNIKVYLIWYDDKIKKPRWSIYVNGIYINGDPNWENALELGLYEGLKLIKNEDTVN